MTFFVVSSALPWKKKYIVNTTPWWSLIIFGMWATIIKQDSKSPLQQPQPTASQEKLKEQR